MALSALARSLVHVCSGNISWVQEKEHRMFIANTLAAREIPDHPGAIPSIDLAEIHGRSIARDDIQYGTIEALSNILGRRPIAHRHDQFLQIHFVESGTFELVNDTIRSRASGPALFFTPAAVPHAFAFSPDAKGHVLTVRQGLVHEILAGDSSLPGPEELHPFCVELHEAVELPSSSNLSNLFAMLQFELGDSAPGAHTSCGGLTSAILATSLRLYTTIHHSNDCNHHQLPLYRRFLGLIELHYRSHLSVSQFAAELGLTEWRMFEIVNNCGGTTPKSLLRNRLVQEARRQLAFSTASVKEVAGYLGFSDSAYFCRFFKRQIGTTPSQYRAQVQQQAAPEKSPT
jgi:AraC family transcriptional regulator, 4-hydroxyphenylacetate 3-monooxygenase operon regulatory protein